ncbi:sphingosine N-acyltransferase lac1 [Puccinia graminis f. sp. tritici]|nr:sphingosine N-acyltransferase lac1 [Puccinia graminis f. sp. tritici]
MSLAGLSIFFLISLYYSSVPITISASPLNHPHPHPQQALAGSAHPHEYILKPSFDILAAPTTRRFNLTVTQTTAALDGFLRPVLAINGQIPGPLIEANEGDRLEITVKNLMDTPLTMHWHGLYQNGTNWEDGVTGVTQCPIPSNGGVYTYKFKLDGQFGTFWYHSHHQNLMADGINGPMIIHSPRDPLKRSVDFDHDVVLMLTDWYHNTSSDIVHELLSEAGHIGTPAAPGANSALINGVGEWNCSLATTSQQCKQVSSPPEFTVTAGQRIRFRLINSGVHAMFFYSVDEHMLNITEADSTPIYGPSDFRHIWLHNGQRYSVIVQTKKEDAGRSFHMRATMDSDCWAWIPNDIQDTAFGILRVVNEDTKPEKISKARPKTRGWPQEFPEECLDIDPRMMVPIVKRSVPTSVVGSGRFEAGFGFQFINNPQEHLTRNDAVKIAKALNLDWTRDRNLREKKKFLSESHRTSSRWGGNDLDSTEDTHDSQQESHSLNADSRKRQLNIRRQSPPPFGGRKNSTGVTRLAGPPPTPAGTIGKYFMNNISWATYPYQPVLHDLTPGGVGAINSSRVANVIFPTAEWYDLYLINVDATGSHPYHLHAMDMHIVAFGRGFPSPERLSQIQYNTENPLRRDTVVVPPASFVVIRLHADIPGAWIMHCHIGWHIAGGFAGVVVVQPEAISRFVIPDENLALCDARTEPVDTIEPGA